MPPSSLSKSPNFSEIYTGFPSKQKNMAAQGLFPFSFSCVACQGPQLPGLMPPAVSHSTSQGWETQGLYSALGEETLNGDIAEVQKGATYQFMIPKSRHCLPAVPTCPPARHKGYS